MFEDKIKKIIGNKRKLNDADGDRVPDKKDCQPHNTMRQDELVHTGGLKEFYYPNNYKFEPTQESKKFVKGYKQWLKNKEGR